MGVLGGVEDQHSGFEERQVNLPELVEPCRTRSRPAARPVLVRDHPNVCTGHVPYVDKIGILPRLRRALR